jgi:predicted transcriptional regulator
MDLEKMMASSCRRRILRVLSRTGRTNVMALVRKVNSTYNQVNSNLQILQKEGIVFDEHFGRMRVIRLNKENVKTRLLLEVLSMLENSRRKSKQQRPAAATR